MFLQKKLPIYSIISEGTSIIGEFLYKNGVKSDGEIKGNVTVANDAVNAVFYLGVNGSVDGDIKADVAIIEGRVTGNISVKTKLILKKTAVVLGNISYNEFSVEAGAKLSGHLSLNE